MAASASHGSLDETLQGIHRAYQGSFANAAARIGATGFPGQGVFTANDVGKFARQLDNNTIWLLTATTPTWVQVGISSLAASAVTNTPAGNIASTDVQAALNELDSEKASVIEPVAVAHIIDGTDAHAASAITNTPAGNIAATNVQTALNELDTEKTKIGELTISGPTTLTIGAVADGDFIKRSGGTVIGSTPGVGGGIASISTAAYGSRPSPGGAGNLFLPNNGFVIERDTGAAWVPWGPLFPFTAPIDGDFSWINQGGASVSTTNGGIFLSGPASLGINVRCRVKTAPATPYVITVATLPLLGPDTSPIFGICWRQTSDGKIIRFGFYQTGGGIPRIQVAKLTDASTFSANYLDQTYTLHGFFPTWLRFSDDGTDRKCFVSADGQNWLEIHTVGRTDFMTANQVGFFVEANSTLYAVGQTLLHWKQT